MTLRTFRRIDAGRLEVVSPTAHVDLLTERYLAGYARHPIERPWLNGALRRKILLEYELAEVIHVSSEYAWHSFAERGVSEDKLRLSTLRVHPRFCFVERAPAGDDVFRVVYVGSLSVTKGLPVLLDAFARFRGPAALTLVGGWGSRAMRRFVERACAADARIQVSPGDPLPHLRRADLLVHPSLSEGLGFAPLEALACGVPVVVTEDTGMKEYLRDGCCGYVVPTGDPAAILDRLERLRCGDLPLSPRLSPA
jgi:glycosyltransferase involved in cell wall biosynthesis